MKEVDMLAAKIDLLMKRLDKCAANKEATKSIVQAMDSHMTCEDCGEVRHLGNNCPDTHEEATYTNNGFQQGNNNSGTISPAHKEVIQTLTQITIRVNLP
jgi:hypothetical protein